MNKSLNDQRATFNVPTRGFTVCSEKGCSVITVSSDQDVPEPCPTCEQKLFASVDGYAQGE